MAVHLVSHVIDYLLGYPRVDIVFEHAHKLAHCQSREGRQQELYEKYHADLNKNKEDEQK